MRVRQTLLLFLSISSFVPSLRAVEWRPVSPVELAMKAPKVEKTADAETLFWDVQVADEAKNNQYPQTQQKHYLRVKIFTERGKETQGTVNIEYFNKSYIGDIYGRTIKADGSVVELTKAAVFDRVIAKAGGLKVRAKSFAMPAVEPGSIIEYKWTETSADELANYVHLPMQRDIPTEEITYHIKPLVSQYFPYSMRSIGFNCDMPPFQSEGKGFFAMTVRDIPGYHTEPEMPPPDQVRKWFLVYYEPDRKLTPDKYWKDTGRELYTKMKVQMKINGEVKELAEKITASAKTPQEKLNSILLYCRKNIKNLDREVTSEERSSAKQNRTTADTLRQGIGSGYEITLAFIALADAAGFDAHMARMADRGQIFFNRSFPSTYFLIAWDAAVNVEGKWLFYDPSNSNIPAGMLRWQEEGQDALILDGKDPLFVKTPYTAAGKSQVSRIANLHLDEEGTLDGDVREILDGHPALTMRADLGKASAAEREEDLKTRLRAQFGEAELSQVGFSIPDDVSAPVGVHYHVKITGFAQRTGKRLFFGPNFFETGHQARFTSSVREHPIYLRYPWSEVDNVTFQLPEGYELDHPDAPGSFDFAPVGSYKVKITVTPSHQINCVRAFTFGADGSILFEKTTYPALKKLFEAVHQSDSHMVTLKASAHPASGGSE